MLTTTVAPVSIIFSLLEVFVLYPSGAGIVLSSVPLVTARGRGPYISARPASWDIHSRRTHFGYMKEDEYNYYKYNEAVV